MLKRSLWHLTPLRGLSKYVHWLKFWASIEILMLFKKTHFCSKTWFVVSVFLLYNTKDKYSVTIKHICIQRFSYFWVPNISTWQTAFTGELIILNKCRIIKEVASTLTTYFEMYGVENGRYGWEVGNMDGMGLWMESCRYMSEAVDVGWYGLGGYGCVVKDRTYFWKSG